MSDNLFDNLQNTVFDVVTVTMGYDAVWNPSAGGSQQTAKVLYKGPSEMQKIEGVDYDPEAIVMEYKKGDFDGLKEAADDSKFEVVTVGAIGDFYVKSVIEKFDGKTLKATLDRKTS